MNITDVADLAYDLVMKVRLLRHYEKSKTAGIDGLSERELLACELIQNFAPLREWQLGRALDLQTTSLIDLVNKLREKGWVEDQIDEADRRQKLLRLTKQGKDFFAQVKRRSARRYWYVFHNIPKLAEMDELKQVLTLMNENATKAIRAGVFDELPSDEDFPPTNLMGLPSFVNAPAKTRGRKIPGRL